MKKTQIFRKMLKTEKSEKPLIYIKIFMILILATICEILNAQSFSQTDNIVLSKTTKREYYKSYKESRKSCRVLIDGKKQSSQMDFLISPNVIKERIKEVWGEDYTNYDEFCWGYYEFDNDSRYRYMVIVEQPINPIAYLLDSELQVDSTIITGNGVLTTDNIYFTERLYDSDESVHLNWYSICDGQVKHLAELEEKTFCHRNVCDSQIPSCFTDNKGKYYFAIENKKNQKKTYYRIMFKVSDH